MPLILTSLASGNRLRFVRRRPLRVWLSAKNCIIPRFLPFSMNSLQDRIARRRVLAIISHPDAGKTTITEKLLLLGDHIQIAGTVKGRKTGRMAASDWMSMEQQRGISVSSSVMQFPWRERVVNLLDTPGHEDFSEDTYRVLTAVDSALMVVDGAKGVEERTVKLMNVCRLRDTPLFTFVNKLDRDIRNPVELIDEIESVLGIACAPVNWPLGMGRDFRGLYDLVRDSLLLFPGMQWQKAGAAEQIAGLHSDRAQGLLGNWYEQLCEEIELVLGASERFDREAYLAGKQTPVYFGTALANFGVRELLDDFVEFAPPPQRRIAETRDVSVKKAETATTPTNREVSAEEENFCGFVFKIQANMDPKHRDRIAFLRICAGEFRQGMKLRHCRTGKTIRVSDALSFMAGDRSLAGNAVAGDIIGLHNHGGIHVGDAFSSGENLKFRGIPHFAPELFRRIQLRDPLKWKQLQKGVAQLAEEGSMQVFMPLRNNDLLIGAIGALQFEVVTHRLREEYGVDCGYEPVSVQFARWVDGDDAKTLEQFRRKYHDNLALDAGGHLAYLAPSRVNLNLAMEKSPGIAFHATREH